MWNAREFVSVKGGIILAFLCNVVGGGGGAGLDWSWLTNEIVHNLLGRRESDNVQDPVCLSMGTDLGLRC